MKLKTLLTVTVLALAGRLAFASTLQSPVPARDQAVPGYQLAQNEDDEMYQKHRGRHWKDRDDDEWYQGQRGHWYRDDDRWQWRGVQGDEWYQGQRGRWYLEQNGWQFASDGLVCNNQGRRCRRGGYIPPNGEGMVSRRNPNFFWACDSEGHNCHWARRPL